MENYLLAPTALARAARKALDERAKRSAPETALTARPDILAILESTTNRFKGSCSGQYVSRYCAFFKSSGKDQATLTTESLEAFEHRWSDQSVAIWGIWKCSTGRLT